MSDTSISQNQAGMIFVDPESGFEARPWPAERDGEAADILADATGEGTTEAGKAAIDAARAGGENRVFAGLLNGELVGVYTLKRDGMANEVAHIAIAKEHRRRGIGHALLQDALRRSGRRPLVAESDQDGLDFYKACGFKMVGRRKQPDGTFRYRIGWHAPGLKFKGGSTNALTHEGVKPGETPSS